MAKVRKKIGTIPPAAVEQKIDDAITQMQADVSDFIDEETAQYPEIGGAFKFVEDPEGRTEIKTDSEDKIISYRDENGVLHENVGIDAPLELSENNKNTLFAQLKSVGYNFMDWSDAVSLKIDTPRLAYVNIICSRWPETKTQNSKAILEFYDMQGNYFKKYIVFNAQGASSMQHPKKNGSIDLFVTERDADNEIAGEDAETFAIKFGNWIYQDSFHVKAYWSDRFKCLNACNYRLYKQIADTRGIFNDRIWKRGLMDFSNLTPNQEDAGSIFGDYQYDDGALCHPDGFPCVISLNGEFYGVYSWQIKKHRDNYKMDKAEASHIHLDVNSSQANLWKSGDISWDYGGSMRALEVRNPKYLVYQNDTNGDYEYDGDYPYEIAGTSSATTWTEGVYAKGAMVTKSGRMYLSKEDNNTEDPALCSYGSKPKDVFKKSNGKKWIEITYTNEVKQSVVDLHNALNTMIDAETAYNASGKTPEDLATLKAVFETYFDKDSIIDYVILIDIIGARDVISNNVQWLTYNGVKWYASPYDLDGCLGQGVGGADAGPFNVHISEIEDTRNPIPMFVRHYTSELEYRYAELSDLGIISVDNIYSKIKSVYDAIGSANYELEAVKWPEENSPNDNIYRLHKYIEVQIANMDNLYNYTRN